MKSLRADHPDGASSYVRVLDSAFRLMKETVRRPRSSLLAGSVKGSFGRSSDLASSKSLPSIVLSRTSADVLRAIRKDMRNLSRQQERSWGRG